MPITLLRRWLARRRIRKALPLWNRRAGPQGGVAVVETPNGPRILFSKCRLSTTRAIGAEFDEMTEPWRPRDAKPDPARLPPCPTPSTSPADDSPVAVQDAGTPAL